MGYWKTLISIWTSKAHIHTPVMAACYSQSMPSYTWLIRSRHRNMVGGWDLGHNTTQRGPKAELVIRGGLVEQDLWLQKFPKHVISISAILQRSETLSNQNTYQKAHITVTVIKSSLIIPKRCILQLIIHVFHCIPTYIQSRESIREAENSIN